MPRRDRGTVRIQLSILPADLVELDTIAADIAEPGMMRNRSAAFRKVLREWLKAQEAGQPRRPSDGR
jgi:hypothetical protein